MKALDQELLVKIASLRDRYTVGGHASRDPNRTAIIFGDEHLSYGALYACACRLAHLFVDELSLTPGARVGVLLRNRPEVVTVGTAASMAGVVAVPINPRFKAEEIAHILTDSRAEVLIYEESLRGEVERLPVAAHLRLKLNIDAPEWSARLEAHPPIAIAPRSLQVVSLRYTSGTTGKPKAARRDLGMLEHFEFLLTLAREFDYRSGDTHLAICPLHHSAPPVFANLTLMLGGTLVLAPRFDAGEWLRLVERHKVTTAFVVPTILQALLDHVRTRGKYADVSSLRSVIVAAARCPVDLKLGISEVFGDVMYEFYGSTEGSVNTILKPADFARRPASCGRAFGATEIRIIGANGHPCAPGERGEICVRTPFMASEYENDPEKTAESFADGFYRTGDIGYVDGDGFYYVVDRAKDMIISGGVNIYPAEIEQCLRGHPDVADVAVVGVPEPRWGEQVKACVVLRPGAVRDELSLRSWCRERIADYKCPRIFVFLDALPVTPEGKVPKRLLRDLTSS